MSSYKKKRKQFLTNVFAFILLILKFLILLTWLFRARFVFIFWLITLINCLIRMVDIIVAIQIEEIIERPRCKNCNIQSLGGCFHQGVKRIFHGCKIPLNHCGKWERKCYSFCHNYCHIVTYMLRLQEVSKYQTEQHRLNSWLYLLHLILHKEYSMVSTLNQPTYKSARKSKWRALQPKQKKTRLGRATWTRILPIERCCKNKCLVIISTLINYRRGNDFRSRFIELFSKVFCPRSIQMILTALNLMLMLVVNSPCEFHKSSQRKSPWWLLRKDWTDYTSDQLTNG